MDPEFWEHVVVLWIDLGGGEEETDLIGLWMILDGGEVTRELRLLLGVHTAPGDLSVLERRRDTLGVQGVGLLGLFNCGAAGEPSLPCWWTNNIIVRINKYVS